MLLPALSCLGHCSFYHCYLFQFHRHLPQLFDDILDTSMLLIMNPPLPDALVPGHSSYCAAVDALEAVALRLLQVC